MQQWTIQHADALTALQSLPDASVDAVVTDPPAGISFMGKDWDNPNNFPLKARSGTRADGGPSFGSGFRINESLGKRERTCFIDGLAEVMSEAHRVLKPGGHALVWALPRTSHWTATALEDAGFEIRDSLHHLFGSGFPKSMDVGKAIDKAAGAERAVTRIATRSGNAERRGQGEQGATYGDAWGGFTTLSDPATDAAKTWDGWGTALKPAHEVWWLVRKPLVAKTVAAQVLDTGTGALNINANRVETAEPRPLLEHTGRTGNVYGAGLEGSRAIGSTTQGRWPSNLILSHAPACDLFTCTEDCPVAELDRQSGVLKSGARSGPQGRGVSGVYGDYQGVDGNSFTASEGGASRFFPVFRYVAKPSRRERNAGLEGLPEVTRRQGMGGVMPTDDRGRERDRFSVTQANHHPTVKSVALMRWLCRLITPPGGLVVDPFMGSGTTGVACAAEGFRFWGCDENAEYIQIATARVSAAYETSPTAIEEAV